MFKTTLVHHRLEASALYICRHRLLPAAFCPRRSRQDAVDDPHPDAEEDADEEDEPLVLCVAMEVIRGRYKKENK